MLRCSVMPFLALALLLLGPTQLWAQAGNPVLVGTVSRVVDGDTLDVVLSSGTIRVRVYGTDTPEPTQPYGKVATVAARALLLGKTVQLEVVKQDRYDRLVAMVYVGDDEYGLAMVRKGYAWAYRTYLGTFEGDEDYCVAEAEAREAERGLWSLPPKDRRAPWEWRRRGDKRYTAWEKETAQDCIDAMEGKQ